MNSLNKVVTGISGAPSSPARSGKLGKTPSPADHEAKGSGICPSEFDAIEIRYRRPCDPGQQKPEEKTPEKAEQDVFPVKKATALPGEKLSPPAPILPPQDRGAVYVNDNGTFTVLEEAGTASTTAAGKAESASSRRETVFDGLSHVEPEIVKEIPKIPPRCDEIPGLKKGHVDVGKGAKLYYEELGKGTPIVLLHGGPGATHHIFHGGFEKAQEFGKVIYYDQRGCGLSDGDPTGKTYTVRQAVEDLESLRKSLGLEKMIVMGHSYGGLLAQCYAMEHPEHVQGLVLTCASPGLPKARLGSRQSSQITSEEQDRINSIYDMMQKGELSQAEGLYNLKLNGDWKRQSYYRPSRQDMARDSLYGWNPARGFRDKMVPDSNYIDIEGAFKGFPVPTLIMESKNDLTWSADKPDIMKKNHPGSTMVLFGASGHNPFDDEPEKFLSTLKSFVQDTERHPVSTPPETMYKNQVKYKEWSEFDEQFLKVMSDRDADPRPLFHTAKRTEGVDAGSWSGIGQNLFRHRHYREAAEAFGSMKGRTKEEPEPKTREAMCRFTSLAWMGYTYEHMGRNEDALKCYREAIKIDIGTFKANYGDGMEVHKPWVEERIQQISNGLNR